MQGHVDYKPPGTFVLSEQRLGKHVRRPVSNCLCCIHLRGPARLEGFAILIGMQLLHAPLEIAC